MLHRLETRGIRCEIRRHESRRRVHCIRLQIPSATKRWNTGSARWFTSARVNARKRDTESKTATGEKDEPEVITAVSSAVEDSVLEAEVNKNGQSVTQQRETIEHNAVETQPFFASYMPSPKVVMIARNGFLLFLGITFFISMLKTVRKLLSPRAKRKRTVNKNRELIEDLIKYLPDKREELTEKAVWLIRMKAGFTPMEVFRKYLWFVLRERKFDQSAVDDLICLKSSLQLSETDVATALKERAQRIYEKYGSLMLNTEGMTSTGVERKATCQALFSKILYLTEHESLLDPESEGANDLSLQEIFGATEEDENKLRIVTLEEVDLDKLNRMVEEDTTQEMEASD